ncbi:hypothetical protein HY095_05295 [Candidatus Micrarchaeota archaeon]|nr:hypothetical protein [Candidatus Micrarchaeota archaeon]
MAAEEQKLPSVKQRVTADPSRFAASQTTGTKQFTDTAAHHQWVVIE